MINKIVLGTMEFGRRLSETQCFELLSKFSSLGLVEIDTASLYANGATEKFLGNLNSFINRSQIKIATKVNPSWTDHGFSGAHLEDQFLNSLKNLNQDEVDMLYLHWPSQCDPMEETLETVNKLFRDGKFKRFGISNYPSWEVMKIWQVCDKHDWIKPTVYQGMYNMLTREVEKELIPCLRNLGMSFYAYNPLAGGILTGRYKFEDLKNFDDNTTPNRFYKIGGKWAKSYQDRFWKQNYFEALVDIEDTLYTYLNIEKTKHQIEKNNDPSFSSPDQNILRLSLSWLMNSSKLDSKYGDAIIMGVSSNEQFDLNIDIMLNKTMSISDEFQHRIDQIYQKHINGVCPNYFR